MSDGSYGTTRPDRTCSLGSVARVSVLLGLGALLLPWSPAWAGVPTDQLKVSVDQVIRILEDPALKSEAKAQERRAAIRKEADKIFDFEETAKRALAKHWQSLGEKDRQEFVSVFADLLQRSYISKIERYSGEKITYAGDWHDELDGRLDDYSAQLTKEPTADQLKDPATRPDALLTELTQIVDVIGGS